MDSQLTQAEISEIAAEAYVYAFPMLMGYRYGYATFLQPAARSYAGPANGGPYGKAVTLDHRFKDVITPNADTPYSFALLDLRAGPLVLSLPEVTGRYYVMQFEDLVGYNELFIGSRATGTDAGSHLLMGPNYEGDVPDGFASSFTFETEIVFIIGRTQLLSADDQPALATVMAEYRLEPLEVFQGGEAPELAPFDWPIWNDEASRDERFIGYMNGLLSLNGPVHPDEAELFQRFASIGIGADVKFDPDALDSETRGALANGVSVAREQIATGAEEFGEKINGWVSSDPFGNRSFYGNDYLKRAAASMMGWGGNDRIEAFYPMVREDSDGDPLDGNSRYQMTLAEPPPAHAFWSVTMYNTSYDGNAGYMVDNPIDRYLINSTTQGLAFDESGGLTVTMQREAPTDPDELANWLPTPDGPFYMALRIYWPKTAALDGTWSPPPVIRA
jgi:hypothetical protein